MSQLTPKQARQRRQELADQDRSVVFTNGCFDLLHAGHVHLLKQARQQGDYLVVGLNSDASVRRLKGDRRPVQSENDRVALLDAIEYVDDVVVFEQDTPLELIRTLKPDVLVKGADYEPDEVVGVDVVRRHGGRLHRVELLEQKGTSRIIEEIRDA